MLNYTDLVFAFRAIATDVSRNLLRLTGTQMELSNPHTMLVKGGVAFTFLARKPKGNLFTDVARVEVTYDGGRGLYVTRVMYVAVDGRAMEFIYTGGSVDSLRNMGPVGSPPLGGQMPTNYAEASSILPHCTGQPSNGTTRQLDMARTIIFGNI